MASNNVKQLILQNRDLLNSNIDDFLDFAFEMLELEEFEELVQMLESINTVKVGE